MLNNLLITTMTHTAECSIDFHEGYNPIDPHRVAPLHDKLDAAKMRTVLMLAIDYAFGGNDFSVRKNNPAIPFVGELEVRIVFNFNGTRYDFIRTTDEPNEVKNTNLNAYYRSHMSIREYQRWLMDMYQMQDTEGFMFYNIVGRFFRMELSGRENLEIYQPLHARYHEHSTTPLRILELLFQRPDSLIESRKAFDKRSEERRVYNAAVEHELINLDNSKNGDDSGNNEPMASSFSKDIQVPQQMGDIGNNNSDTMMIPTPDELYNPYEDEDDYPKYKVLDIDHQKKLQLEKARYGKARMAKEFRQKELYAQKQKSLQDIDASITRRLDDVDKETVTIKRKLAVLYDQKLMLQSQIKTISDNISGQESVLSSDIERVRRFFPDADLLHIEEVNEFHSKIGNILLDEMQEELVELNGLLEDVVSEINELTDKIKSNGELVNMSSEGLIQYEKIVSDSAITEEQYKLAAKGEEITIAFEDAEARKEYEEDKFFKDMTERINHGLQTYGVPGDNNPWRFEINEDFKFGHSLYHPKSQQGYDGIIAFDLALLDSTQLPVVFHNSEMFKRMSDDTLNQMIRSYEKCTKQVFVNFGKELRE